MRTFHSHHTALAQIRWAERRDELTDDECLPTQHGEVTTGFVVREPDEPWMWTPTLIGEGAH